MEIWSIEDRPPSGVYDTHPVVNGKPDTQSDGLANNNMLHTSGSKIQRLVSCAVEMVEQVIDSQ